jgi:hypothetical protein
VLPAVEAVSSECGVLDEHRPVDHEPNGQIRPPSLTALGFIPRSLSSAELRGLTARDSRSYGQPPSRRSPVSQWSGLLRRVVWFESVDDAVDGGATDAVFLGEIGQGHLVFGVAAPDGARG